MESNALEKSKNSSVTSKFFTHTLSKIQQILRICEVLDLFFESCFDFSLDFFVFGIDTNQKLGIINLISYSSRIYVSIVLSDSEVAFLGEEKDPVFVYFSIVLCL